MNRKLTPMELALHRAKLRRAHKSPIWGDHVLHGRRGFTVAMSVTASYWKGADKVTR